MNRSNLFVVAVIVFIVSGTVQGIMNLYLVKGSWTWTWHLDSAVVAAVITSLFWLWRKQHAKYLAAVQAYSYSRRARLHRIRSVLQVLMFLSEENTPMQRKIRELDQIVDEPVLDDIVQMEAKIAERVMKASAS